MPAIHADNLSRRIEAARAAFGRSETVDGKPFPYKARKETERLLVVTPDMRDDYMKGAEWGVQQGLIEVSEYARIQSALTGTLDPVSGWHVACDLAAKVIVTKVCNELLEQRGDA